jgi:hypothetical protein
MATNAELLKSMLQDFINGREEQASVTMHEYFVNKTREVTGLGQRQEQEVQTDDQE